MSATRPLTVLYCGLRLGELPFLQLVGTRFRSAAFFMHILYVDESGDGGSVPGSSLGTLRRGHARRPVADIDQAAERNSSA